MHKNTFEASGHLKNFTDPIVSCQNDKCNWNTRADHLLEEHTTKRQEGLSNEELTKQLTKLKIKCPACKKDLADVETMNMMFPIKLGTGGKNSKNVGYLRPETAQSPYVNFKAQYELQRKKLPLGLALIGRAYRNEISPRNFTLRQREFTQAELQIFFNPNKIEEHDGWKTIENTKLQVLLLEDRKASKIKPRTANQLNKKHNLPKFYIYHLAKIQEFYLNTLRLPKDKLRFYQLNDKEKAFYNKYHFDIEANLQGHSWTEIGGLHYRTDHDLKGHQKVSKQKMEVFDEESKQKFIPHVLELSFGVDRNVYTLLDHAYQKADKRGNDVLNLPNNLIPFTAAVFPLVKNKQIIKNKAIKIYESLKNDNINVFYDESSSIGKRYARADEIGIKHCITIDFETNDDKSVTIRDRVTTKQKRIKIKDLIKELS